MLDRIVNVLATAAGVLLCALIALICLDVLSRNLNLFAISWSLEAAELMLYGITFFAAPWVLKTGGHISIDLLIDKLPERTAATLARITNAVGAAVSGVLLYYSVVVTIRFLEQSQQVYGALNYPKWCAYLPAPLTFLLMLLIFLRWVVWPATLAETRQQSEDGL